ncbi:MAG: hypothetical protein ACLT28_04080 [Bifidobacterium longum]
MAEKIASGWNQPTKIDSLKTAVNKFINATAAENAKITDQSQRNRIALVKFAGTEKTSVGNDFYREGWSSYNYTQIVSNLDVRRSGLTSTVNGLSVRRDLPTDAQPRPGGANVSASRQREEGRHLLHRRRAEPRQRV